MASQVTDKIVFGSGRLFVNTPAGNRLAIADLNDISVDFKCDLKEIYGENSYPIAVADGHRQIDIQAKHYRVDLQSLALDLGGNAVGASSKSFVFDEAGIIATNTYTLASSGAIPNSTDVVVYTVPAAGQVQPKRYNQTSGSPVAGVSYSVAGQVLTFAAGDNTLAIKVTYQIANTNGTSTLLTNVVQNTTPTYSMCLVKRDKNPVDGSQGQLLLELNAVRPGGAKMQFKEGDFTNFDRMYKAFADGSGNVGTITFVNV